MLRFLQSTPLFFPCLAALALVAAVWEDLTGPTSEDPSRPVISNMAWLAVSAWGTAVTLTIVFRALQAARGFYVWGCLTYLVHFLLAFHIGLGDSHAKAFQHVEDGSGFGPGIFVSYGFTLTWLADATWCVFAFKSYRMRSRKWDYAIHGFLAFVIFNGTVVYGHGVGRWLSGVFFTAIAIVLLARKSQSPGEPRAAATGVHVHG